ncbi:MAG: hypothetical protein UIM53_08505 [Acutalibacteraceae bacterium]|nr:hypothetical protein [Acutalibacteraceae bacterium]
MKRRLFAFLIVICLTFSSCSLVNSSDSKTETEEQTEIYIIPNSYFEFIGTEISKSVESCLALGDEYCTAAEEVADGMQLKLTAEQKNNLIKRNDDYVDKLVGELTQSNSMYKCELDDSYKSVKLYYDEKITTMLQAQTMLGIVSNYGMNYMLVNNTTEWNVKLEIFNCHTNKLVASVNIPDEKISYGAKEWEESYND